MSIGSKELFPYVKLEIVGRYFAPIYIRIVIDEFSILIGPHWIGIPLVGPTKMHGERLSRTDVTMQRLQHLVVDMGS